VPRYTRQSDLVPTQELNDTPVTVVGVGAGGRQIVVQLATMGCPNIKIIDFDKVEEHNLGSQGFLEKDLGSFKVDAVKKFVEQINPEIKIENICSKFKNEHFSHGALFCCVDSISTREKIYNQTKDRFDIMIDGRMSAEFMRILCIFNDESKKYYESQLFPQSEAYVGSCTAKTTFYCANILAGIKVAQFAKWLRMCPLEKEVNFNLLTNEFFVEV